MLPCRVCWKAEMTEDFKTRATKSTKDTKAAPAQQDEMIVTHRFVCSRIANLLDLDEDLVCSQIQQNGDTARVDPFIQGQCLPLSH